MDVILIAGTRPEYIKLKPISDSLARLNIDHKFCHSYQHPIADTQAYQLIPPNFFLTTPDDEKSEGNILACLRRHRPKIVLVQGDTRTAMAGAVGAHQLGIQVVHVEAGLRSGSLKEPFPEEFHRVSIAKLANWHCCPTETNRKNLILEGVPEAKILITGNTVVDAYIEANSSSCGQVQLGPRFQVIWNIHRRETDEGRWQLLASVAKAIYRFQPSWQTLAIVQQSPLVKRLHQKWLPEWISQSPPVPFLMFQDFIRHANLVVTDSGGTQEECLLAQVPTLIFRELTDRPVGLNQVLGKPSLGPAGLQQIAKNLCSKPPLPPKTGDGPPKSSQIPGDQILGDGQAGKRIAELIRSILRKPIYISLNTHDALNP